VAEAGIALHSGAHAKAIAQLTPQVEARPLDAEALLLLAEAYQREENHEEAEFYLQRVLSIPERKVDALIAMGRLEVSRGELEAALPYLREALAQAPNRPGLARYLEAIEDAGQ
jgi:tetratricopeptide (TPR) repeat protein